jgi:DNA-binding NtrC family response regulator
VGGGRDFDAQIPDMATIEARLEEVKVALLVVTAGGICEFELPASDVCVIGRAATAQIIVDDASVSRRHAQLRLGREGPLLKDLGGRNGTFVNGARVDDNEVQLKLGDVVQFGSVLAFLQQVRKSTPVPRLMGSSQLIERLREEAERCVRFDRAFSVVVVEATETVAAPGGLEAAIGAELRPLDCFALRSSGRADVLLPESSKAEAIAVAARLAAAVRAAGVIVRLGVATYPSDAPSTDALLLAAELALRDVPAGEIAVAREASRVLTIGSHEVVVAEPAMLRLFALAERAASLRLPVLITGETGTGKEVIAEAVHVLGSRSGGPLVKLNCASVPDNLLESELFGYERGAFSGAINSKPGLFETAEHGTLMLDEIGELSPNLQAKLLRVIEDQRIRRLGGVQDRRVDVRIVAATHRDLTQAIAENRFRQDLYYRLNTIVLAIPPLRVRGREIPLLAERFVAEAARAMNRARPGISPAAMAALETYHWPGNVRELRNVLSRAMVECEGDELCPEHLPSEIVRGAGARSAHGFGGEGDMTISAAAQVRPAAPHAGAGVVVIPDGLSFDESVATLERVLVERALREANGIVARAAERLKMERTRLTKLRRRLGLGD